MTVTRSPTAYFATLSDGRPAGAPAFTTASTNASRSGSSRCGIGASGFSRKYCMRSSISASSSTPLATP